MILNRGEQHAAALEANLTNLESKLDALLASIEGISAATQAAQGKKTDQEKQEPEAKE